MRSTAGIAARSPAALAEAIVKILRQNPIAANSFEYERIIEAIAHYEFGTPGWHRSCDRKPDDTELSKNRLPRHHDHDHANCSWARGTFSFNSRYSRPSSSTPDGVGARVVALAIGERKKGIPGRCEQFRLLFWPSW